MSKRDFWVFTAATIVSMIFIFLRITDYIDWPWYWLISPVWAVAGLYLASYAVIIGLFLLDGFIHRGHEKE